jgi:DNA-binding transcriptional regulator LsrR (DeoR family)
MYDKHMSRASIAVALGVTEQELHKEIAFLRKHKFLWNRKPDQYDPLMDNRVKKRF